jgi:hypothetical protein
MHSYSVGQGPMTEAKGMARNHGVATALAELWETSGRARTWDGRTRGLAVGHMMVGSPPHAERDMSGHVGILRLSVLDAYEYLLVEFRGSRG